MRQGDRVLRLVSHVLAWQDRWIEEFAVEVDGERYVPDWLFGGDMPIPAQCLVELLDEAMT